MLVDVLQRCAKISGPDEVLSTPRRPSRQVSCRYCVSGMEGYCSAGVVT